MFISWFKLYWSLESVISRLRCKYKAIHGFVVSGHTLSKDGKRVVPNPKNLVIEVLKNGIEESITVTPDFETVKPVILVMLPLSLVQDQVHAVQNSPRKCVWHAGQGVKILAIKQEEHIALRFKAPFDKENEDLLHFLVHAAYMQVDSESDEDEGDVLVVGETRDGHEVVMV